MGDILYYLSTPSKTASTTEQEHRMQLHHFHRQAMDYAASTIRRLTIDNLDTQIVGCPDWTAADLVSHLAMVNTMCANATEGKGPELLPTPDALVGDDPITIYHATSERFSRSFEHDALLEQAMPTPIGEHPGATVLTQGSIENLIHGWDLDRSLGDDYGMPEELAIEAIGRILNAQAIYAQFFELEFFAPSGKPPVDATPEQRLTTYLGRNQ